MSVRFGYCHSGGGELFLDGKRDAVSAGDGKWIPANYPHVTISNTEEGPSFWEYLFWILRRSLQRCTRKMSSIRENYWKRSIRNHCLSMSGRTESGIDHPDDHGRDACKNGCIMWTVSKDFCMH